MHRPTSGRFDASSTYDILSESRRNQIRLSKEEGSAISKKNHLLFRSLPKPNEFSTASPRAGGEFL